LNTKSPEFEAKNNGFWKIPHSKDFPAGIIRPFCKKASGLKEIQFKIPDLL
jgi:hypothetical protein